MFIGRDPSRDWWERPLRRLRASHPCGQRVARMGDGNCGDEYSNEMISYMYAVHLEYTDFLLYTKRDVTNSTRTRNVRQVIGVRALTVQYAPNKFARTGVWISVYGGGEGGVSTWVCECVCARMRERYDGSYTAAVHLCPNPCRNAKPDLTQ